MLHPSGQFGTVRTYSAGTTPWPAPLYCGVRAGTCVGPQWHSYLRPRRHRHCRCHRSYQARGRQPLASSLPALSRARLTLCPCASRPAAAPQKYSGGVRARNTGREEAEQKYLAKGRRRGLVQEPRLKQQGMTDHGRRELRRGRCWERGRSQDLPYLVDRRRLKEGERLGLDGIEVRQRGDAMVQRPWQILGTIWVTAHRDGSDAPEIQRPCQ